MLFSFNVLMGVLYHPDGVISTITFRTVALMRLYFEAEPQKSSAIRYTGHGGCSRVDASAFNATGIGWRIEDVPYEQLAACTVL